MKILLSALLLTCFQSFADIPAQFHGEWEGQATYYEDFNNQPNVYGHRFIISDDTIKQISGNLDGTGGQTKYISNVNYNSSDPNYFLMEQIANGKYFGPGSGYCRANRCTWTATVVKIVDDIPKKTKPTQNPNKKHGHQPVKKKLKGFTYTDTIVLEDPNTLKFFGHHIKHDGKIFHNWSATLTRVTNP
jgi:hypothetical protein